MREYKVILSRGNLGDVCIYSGDRKEAVLTMVKYVKENGFTITTNKGRFSVNDVVLVEYDNIVDGQVYSRTSFIDVYLKGVIAWLHST